MGNMLNKMPKKGHFTRFEIQINFSVLQRSPNDRIQRPNLRLPTSDPYLPEPKILANAP